jgi:hypothetical protein
MIPPFKHAVMLAVAGVMISHTARAACSSSCRPDGKQASGAIYRICMPEPPSCRNGGLVIYAHGYVDAYQPLAIPEDQLTLPDGTSVPGLINGLGFAFATTSYSRNGLAVVEGVRDVRDLVDVYARDIGSPGRIYLAGPSEGGVITAKAIETYPAVFTGGLAACGPLGSFRAQINYIGDFRVVFDYFFPGVIPGKATRVPQFVIDNWDAVYLPRIRAAVRANPAAAAELIRVARVPIGLNPFNIEDAILSVAWYAVFATNDATQQLGGQPFDNIGKWYAGSGNDLRLNLLVERAAASPQALATMQKLYETTGLLSKPLVTLHTTGDQIIPFWHDLFYAAKIASTGSGGNHVSLPVLRYGHCNFNAAEVLFGFALLVLQTSGQEIQGLRPVPSSITNHYDTIAQ